MTAAKALSWLWALLGEGLQQGFRTHPAVAAALEALSASVLAGDVTPTVACRRLLELYRSAGTRFIRG